MPQEPTPVLKEGVIYLGDNGQATCVHCAGASAKFTGYDISGQEVLPCTRADAEEYEKHRNSNPVLKEILPKEFSCECKKTKYQTDSSGAESTDAKQ